MRKFNYIEIMDCRWFPSFLRDIITDGLELMNSNTEFFDRLIPDIQIAMDKTDTKQIIDLCSGGGGPWIKMFGKLKEEEPEAKIIMTDLYPNMKAENKISPEYEADMSYLPISVDATDIPAELQGVRTLFGGFHHMSPSVAKGILENAAKQGMGIVAGDIYFFPPKATWLSLPVQILFSPISLISWWLMLRKVMKGKPLVVFFRILFTYLIPIVPLVMMFDSFMSGVRVYMQDDLKEMTDQIQVDGYTWKINTLQGEKGAPPLSYVVGYKNAGE